MLASYLLDATRPGHPLEETALEHLGYKALTEEDVCGRAPRRCRCASPGEAALTFAGERADLARQLVEPAGAAARDRPAGRGLRDARDAAPAGARRHRAGRRPHRRPGARAQSQHIEGELAERAERIYELAGEEFNVNSPKQLGEILFEQAAAAGAEEDAARPVGVDRGRGAGGAGARPRAAAPDPGLARPAQAEGHVHRRAAALVHPRTGRVHTCFNQAVAATGRLSSSDPNLQNIPIRTELGARSAARSSPRPATS